MYRFFSIIILVSAALHLISVVYAMPPPHPSLIYKMRKSGKIQAFSAYKRRLNTVVQRSSGQQFAPQRATKKTIKTGTPKVIAIPVEFTDVKFGKTNDQVKQELREILFGTTSSVQKYYKEVSNGNFYPTEGIIADVVTSTHTKAYYGGDGSGIDDQNVDIWNLVSEAVALADSQVDFSQYDNDGADGIANTSDDDDFVDFVFIFQAGGAQEASGNSSDIWSHRWAVHDNENYTGLSKDGVYISTYIMMSLSSPMGIIAHEFGHDLGFYDIYDTDYTSNGIGNWGLMSGGVWGGNGSNRDGSAPAWPVAWHLKQAGWLNVTDISNSAGSKSLVDIHTSHAAYLIGLDNKGVNAHQEYFLIANRQKPSIGYDSQIPGSGLLVWHVDETIMSQYNDPNKYNANELHPLIRLVQADGLKNLENAVNQGDAQDPFYGKDFDISSNPRSFSYNNSYYAVLKNISASSTTMSFDHILKYNIGVFQNPADEKEIIVSVKPSFHLYNDTLSVSVYESGATTEVQTKAYSSGSDSHTVYSGSYRLGSAYGAITVKVNGADDTGTSRIASASVTDTGYIQFQAAPVQNTSFSLASNSEEFSISFAPHSVSDKNVMLCIPQYDQQTNDIYWNVSSAKLSSPAQVLFKGQQNAYTSIYVNYQGNWEFLETTYENTMYSAKTTKTGSFALKYDDIDPVISAVNEFEHMIFVKDEQSGLRNVTVHYSNGSHKQYAVDPYATSVYADIEGFSYIQAVDRQNNETVYYAPQRVPISITLLQLYPNPCVDEISFSYALSLPADHVTLKIYDTTGDRVYSVREYNTQNDEIFWDTVNEDGEPVASGVYYYKFTVNNNGDENIEKGKFAVIR